MSGKYGDAWDRFPVVIGEQWTAGPHRFLCADILEDVDHVVETSGKVDVIYTDPPWNQAVLRKFYTYAYGSTGAPLLQEVLETFGILARATCPNGVIGVEFSATGTKPLVSVLGNPRAWIDGTYGASKTKLVLWLGTFRESPIGMVPPPRVHHGWELCEWAMDQFIRPGMKFLDPFCGAGNFPLRAAKRGALVTGVELIPRKLAQTLKAFEQAGFRVTREQV